MKGIARGGGGRERRGRRQIGLINLLTVYKCPRTEWVIRIRSCAFHDGSSACK